MQNEISQKRINLVIENIFAFLKLESSSPKDGQLIYLTSHSA